MPAARSIRPSPREGALAALPRAAGPADRETPRPPSTRARSAARVTRRRRPQRPESTLSDREPRRRNAPTRRGCCMPRAARTIEPRRHRRRKTRSDLLELAKPCPISRIPTGARSQKRSARTRRRAGRSIEPGRGRRRGPYRRTPRLAGNQPGGRETANDRRDARSSDAKQQDTPIDGDRREMRKICRAQVRHAATRVGQTRPSVPPAAASTAVSPRSWRASCPLDAPARFEPRIRSGGQSRGRAAGWRG